MPDTIEQLRTATESSLQSLLAKLRPNHRERVLAAISEYGNVGNVPQAFWNELQADIENESIAAMLLLLVAVYTKETTSFGLDPPDERQLRTQATPAAQALGRDVARDYVDAIRGRLTDKIDSRIGELNAAGAEAARAVIKQEIDDVIDVPQAESSTITNTTRGVSTAQGSAFDDVGRATGQAIDQKWVTEKDARVCPTCSPLEGRPSIDWVEKFPSGPPAHPRCRCRLAAYFPVGVN